MGSGRAEHRARHGRLSSGIPRQGDRGGTAMVDLVRDVGVNQRPVLLGVPQNAAKSAEHFLDFTVGCMPEAVELDFIIE